MAGSTAARRSVPARSDDDAEARHDPLRRYAAELVGTAILVIVGVGSAVLIPTATTLDIALAFGLTLLVLAYGLGPVSGCHINPAVTLGVTLARRLSVRDAAAYVVAQVVGGVLGAAVVLALAAQRPGYERATDGLGANGWGAHSANGYPLLAALMAEVILTGLLVFVVLAVTESASSAAVAGIPIGITLVVCHVLAIGIDGTSVNPARSIGPALFAGGAALGQLWLFVLAPLLGSVLAAGLYRVLQLRGTRVDDDSTAEPAD